MAFIQWRVPALQPHRRVEAAFLQAQAQIARQRRIAIGQIGEGEFGQAGDMTDMGVTVIGEGEGKLDQMRRAGTKAQNILVKDRIVRLARPDPVGIVEKGRCGHGNLNQLRVGDGVPQHTVGKFEVDGYS